ncbi:MAG: hypothetical protein JSS75_07725 [Bacteroidetes bacterium]|nr:hypothetical protein [Bacteroidota bacterium]
MHRLYALLFLLVCSQAAVAQRANYDSLLSAMPTEVTGRVYQLVNDGEAFQSTHDYDSAINCYHKILEILPNFAPALTTISGLYGVSERYRQEIYWAHKAIAADSMYLNAWLNLGNAYASLKSYDTATMIFTLATHVDSRSPIPAYSLGTIEEEQGHYQQALTYYIFSSAIDSNFTNGYYNAAMMYAQLGNPEEAKKMLLRQLEIDPYAKDAEIAYKEIEAKQKELENKDKKATKKRKK